MTNAPIIEARELHTYYGASHILHGVDFSVRAGESIGLMGRNGMAKPRLFAPWSGMFRRAAATSESTAV